MSEKKKLTVNMIYSFILWYKKSAQDNGSLLNQLGNISKWHMRQNYNKMLPIGESFEEMLNDERNRVQSKYINDDLSIADENGNRQIKAEYMDEYRNDLNELQKSIEPILAEVKEMEVETIAEIDVNSAIEKYTRELSNEDMDMMSVFIG